MRPLRVIDDIVARIERAALSLMLGLIVGVNLMQIGLRMLQSVLRVLESGVVLNIPSWPSDVNRVLVLWIAMVGGSLATRRNEHIKVDVIARALSERARRWLNRVICLVGMIVSAGLVYFSIDFLKMEYELGETLVAVPVPLWAIQLIMPMGFFTISYRFLLLVVDTGDTATRASGQDR